MTRRSRARPVVATVAAVVVLLAACEQPPVRSSRLVVDEEGRVEQVRRARTALAAPVPPVVAASRAYRDLVGEILAAPGDSEGRATSVTLADPSAVVAATDALAAVELVGDGPDVRAARAAVAELTAAATAVVEAGAAELADLPPLAEADGRLAVLVAGWDEPGSRSQQVERLGTLEEEARAAATAFDGSPSALPCVGAWERRVAAAETVATRTAELRGFVSAFDGASFDAARSAYRADPYDTGGVTLGDLDAAAASSCWAASSAVVAGHERVEETVDALEEALDPPDLRAP